MARFAVELVAAVEVVAGGTGEAGGDVTEIYLVASVGSCHLFPKVLTYNSGRRVKLFLEPREFRA